MFNLIVQTQNGEILDFAKSTDKYDILSVEGISSPDTTINTSNLYFGDGCVVNSTKVEKRNIVINLNIKKPIEKNRIELYRFFACNANITLYWSNDTRDTYIAGFVEKFETNLFDKVQQPQISIICPQPYFISTDTDIVKFSENEELFEFPFSIEYPPGVAMSEIKSQKVQSVDVGEAVTGIKIKISAVGGSVKNPSITNRTTGETFTVEYTMSQNQQLLINSTIGEKSIYLLNGSTKNNILARRKLGSKWTTCLPGQNYFSCDAETGAENMIVEYIINKKYQGV